MYVIRKNGATSNSIRVELRSSVTGNGLTGLTISSSGLIISTICDVEASATTYTAAGSTIETIATLGTFATPTATKCRFKEVDPTNHPGDYELQFADARFAVASAKVLRITITGAANLIDKKITVQLDTFDLDSATPDVNTVKIGPTGAGTPQTAGDIYGYLTTNLGALGASLSAIPKTGFKLASDGLAAITAWTVAITGNITGSLSGSVGSVTGAVGSVTGSVGSVAGAVGSVTGGIGGDVSGKVLGGGSGTIGGDGVRASSVTGAVGSVTGAVGSVTGSVGSVVGLTASNLDTTVSSRSTLTQTQVTGGAYDVTNAACLVNRNLAQLLSATFVSGSVGEAEFNPLLQQNRKGTAQGGSSTTITLDSGANGVDNDYVGNLIVLYSGTGASGIGGSQPRTITSYNGTTKVATVDRAYTTPPDNTSKFAMFSRYIGIDWSKVTNQDATVDLSGTTISGISTGTGAYAVTITVNDGSAVIQNATVTLAINASRYTGTTDSSGVVVLSPDEGNGTYNVRIVASGYQFTPVSLVVSGDTPHTYSMTATAITVSPPGTVTGYATTYETDGSTVASGVVVEYYMSRPETGATGAIIDPEYSTVTSDDDGYVELLGLRPGAHYKARSTRVANQAWKEFTAGNSNFAITAFVG